MDLRLHIRRRLNGAARWFGKLGLAAALLFFSLNLLFPFRVEVDFSTIISDRDGNILHAFLSDDDKWRMEAQLDEITEELATAFIAKEDRNFRIHPGVDPIALTRALWRNTTTGRRTSGASTIPMQVIRLLEPRPRTYRSKLIEMFRATQMTMLYSKDEVLQLYLNLVPYGGNIEGVKAAALLYLDKPPEKLSLAEITALTVIPNRPGSLHPGKHNAEIIAARNHWLDYFERKGVFPEADLQLARVESFRPVRHAAPAQAAHWGYRLRAEYPDRSMIRSTLDMELQQKAEATLSRHMKRIRGLGIQNSAVIVLDNRTAETLVYIGSADFHDSRDGGQVDGLQALRSPGSTLKPILYGLAMDSGSLTPGTVLLDVPTEFSGYRPRNYDRGFQGKVTVSEAIAKSLNVPAVRVLDGFGIENFRRALANAGVGSMEEQRGRLGLSMVLGGCGIRPEELAALYRSLADGGLHRPATQVLSDNRIADTTRLFSEETAWALGHMLTTLTRPDMPSGYEYALDRTRIAWKTGTSYGRKDAWSVGLSRDFTILVWAGNFSGRGIPELTGSLIATPILFDVFEAVDQSSRKAWFPYPEKLIQRWVCPETGLSPSPLCQTEVVDSYIPLVSSNRKCNHLTEVRIASDSTMTYCAACLPEAGWKLAVYPNPPSELKDWYDHEGIAYRNLPSHNPHCQQVFAGEAPVIVSPVPELTYYTYPGSGQLRLACQTAANVGEVFWYLNDAFIGSGPPSEDLFIPPAAGKLKISCADDKGRHRDVWITVEGL